MNTKSTAVFTRTIYSDFLRFMLASLATGMVAAMLLSSAVIWLSAPKANLAGDALSFDGGMRARTTWAGLPGAEAA